MVDGDLNHLAKVAEIAAAAGFTGFGGAVYFSGVDTSTGTARKLHRVNADGSVELVSDLNTSGGSNPHNLMAFDSALYFTADDGTIGSELWRLNGDGTLESFDFLTGSDGSDAEVLGVVNGHRVVRAFIDRDGDGTEDARPTMLASDGSPATLVDFSIVDNGSGTLSPDPLGNTDPIVIEADALVP